MAGALCCMRRHEPGSREPGRAHRRRFAPGPETGLQLRGLLDDASAKAPKPLRQIAPLHASRMTTDRRSYHAILGERRMARIAFVGLGNMGQGMASRLLESGHQLNLYNRTALRAETLVRRGAQLFGSPKEACMGVDAVIS